MKKKILIAGIACVGILGLESAQAARPDFMILGVTKCGTTSLYKYMVQHPQILGANKKEVHFFDGNFENGMAWYEQQFPQKPNDKMLIGEASPGYFWKDGCAERILKHCPKTKFIVIFRDPVKRIVSEYFRRQRRGQETQCFDQAITRTRTYPNYLGAGMYIQHLKRWLSLFPKEQIHILFLEDLAANPEKEVNKIFSFLRLKKHTLDSYEVYNQATNATDTIRAETIQDLKKFYAPYNKKLEEFLGRTLPWQKYS